MRWVRGLVVAVVAAVVGVAMLPAAARGAPGDLPAGLTDPAFGMGGIVAPPPLTGWRAGVVEGDGSIALGGASTVGHFSDSGAADVSFGGDGLVDLTADLGLSLGGDITVDDIAPVPGGGLVVLISVSTWPLVDQHLVALTATGSLDTGFAAATPTPGRVQLAPAGPYVANLYNRVLRQSSGRLVVVRSVGFGSDTTLAAYTAGGAHDAGFGSGGDATIPGATFSLGPNDCCTTLGMNGHTAAELDGSDRIVLGGRSAADVGALTRLDADGSTDAGFGSGGIATRLIAPTDANSHVGSLVVDASGAVTAGLSGGPNPGPAIIPETAAVWRVDSTGADDAAFGSGGVTVVYHDPILGGTGAQTWAIAKGPSGRTWVQVDANAGAVIGPQNPLPPFITRLDATGASEGWTRLQPLGLGGLLGMADGGALLPGVAARILPSRTGTTPDYVDITVSWDVGPTIRASGWLTSGDIVAQRQNGRISALLGSGTFTDASPAATPYSVVFNARSFLFFPIFMGSIQLTGGLLNFNMPLFFTGFQSSARGVHTAPKWFYLTWNPFHIGSSSMDVTFYDGN